MFCSYKKACCGADVDQNETYDRHVLKKCQTNIVRFFWGCSGTASPSENTTSTSPDTVDLVLTLLFIYLHVHRAT